MNTYNIHPYLVASTPHNDYGTIVCPQIVERQFQLSKATNRIAEDKIIVRNFIIDDKTYKLVYKCEKIIKPGTENEIMVDAVGRDLYMHYGFLLDDSAIESKPLGELLKKTKEYLQPHLEKRLITSDGGKIIKSNVLTISDIPSHTPHSEEYIAHTDFLVQPVPQPQSSDSDKPITQQFDKKKGQSAAEEALESSFIQSGSCFSPSGNDAANEKMLESAKIAKITLTVGCSIVLVDGVRRLNKAYQKRELTGESKKGSDSKRGAFIGSLELLASLSGILFLWATPIAEKYIAKLSSRLR